ncbi:hypothetical protein, partial [Faecalibacterium prausnitzii]|uniref:hypothetical protein n=1 Tax=Faecalibacterium prausnitzii TaxID=853 RepID=UPI001A9A4BDB
DVLREPLANFCALSSWTFKVSFLLPMMVCFVSPTTATSSLKLLAFSGLESNAVLLQSFK